MPLSQCLEEANNLTLQHLFSIFLLVQPQKVQGQLVEDFTVEMMLGTKEEFHIKH